MAVVRCQAFHGTILTMNVSLIGSYMRKRGLRPAERLVALALAVRCDKRWNILEVNQRTLRQDTSLTDAALRRALEGLQDKGAIERWQRGRRSPTTYTLTPHGKPA